jgi:hypothetical protein
MPFLQRLPISAATLCLAAGLALGPAPPAVAQDQAGKRIKLAN